MGVDNSQAFGKRLREEMVVRVSKTSNTMDDSMTRWRN